MDAVQAKIKVVDAVQTRFFFNAMEKIYQGNMATVNIELRDPDGDLYTPNRPNPAIGVLLFRIDSDGNLADDPIMEVNATQVVLDGNFPVDGHFRAVINTRNLSPARYIIRAVSPYGSGDVLAQTDFWVKDPAVEAP